MTTTADRQSDQAGTSPARGFAVMASHPSLGLRPGVDITPMDDGCYRIDVDARTVGFLETGRSAWDVSVGSRRAAAQVIARDRDFRGGLRTLSGGVR